MSAALQTGETKASWITQGSSDLRVSCCWQAWSSLGFCISSGYWEIFTVSPAELTHVVLIGFFKESSVRAHTYVHMIFYIDRVDWGQGWTPSGVSWFKITVFLSENYLLSLKVTDKKLKFKDIEEKCLIFFGLFTSCVSHLLYSWLWCFPWVTGQFILYGSCTLLIMVSKAVTNRRSLGAWTSLPTIPVGWAAGAE